MVHRHFGRSNAREENVADRAQLTDCKCEYALYKMADAHDAESLKMENVAGKKERRGEKEECECVSKEQYENEIKSKTQ